MRTLLAVILIAALAPAFNFGAAHAQGPGSSTPAITLSPSTISPGDTVGVAGSGFTPGSNVSVAVTVLATGTGSKTLSKTVTPGTDGKFSTSLTLFPDSTPGSYTVHAVGPTASDSASKTLTVVPGLSVTNSVFTAGQATTVSVNGAGFGSGQHVQVALTIRRSSSTVTIRNDVTAANDGTFGPTQLQIPADIEPGIYTVQATGTNPDRSATSKIHAVLVTANPSTVKAGQNVTLTGKGFVPNTTRVVYATFTLNGGASRQTIVVKPLTDANGDFTAILPVPGATTGGTYTIHVGTSTTSTDLTHVSLTVQPIAVPSIAVSDTSIAPGETITVSGRNFGANRDVTLSATVPKLGGGNLTVRTTTRTGSAGTFTTHFTIPTNAAPGSIIIRATSSLNNTTLTASGRVTILARQPALSVSTSSVRPGQTIAVSGTDFRPNTVVTIRATVPLYGGGSRAVTVSVRTGPAGGFSTHFTVPGRAAAASFTITAYGPAHAVSARLQVQTIRPSITVSPASVVPGSTVTIHGSGYLANATIDVHVGVTLTNGSTTTLRVTATTNGSGAFQTQLHIPQTVRSGSYQVTAAGSVSGRTPTARLTIVKLSPSVVVAPTTTTPGSKVTVNGYGFASQASITVDINGQPVGTARAGAAGEFSIQVTVPASLATGSYVVSATSQANRSASTRIAVNRSFNTHYYIGALYTGHQESLAILNPTSITARVTITYQTTTSRTITRTFQVAGHRTYIRNVNADLGPRVSAAAMVSADVAIAVTRVNHQNGAVAIVPGNPKQSTSWYFATGNTGGKYRVYLAIQNTSSSPADVRIRFMPGHHKAFTIYRTIPATSRKTLKVNNFVHHDSVGITVFSNRPVVANRTIKVLNGVNSKAGATSPSHTWYFAGGPRNPEAHNWLNLSSPNAKYTYVTISAYGPDGALLRSKNRWLKPNARTGIFMRTFAGQNDAAIKITASRPIVAEDMTYVGRQHDAYTDTFGVRAPVTTRLFPAVSTLSAGSHEAGIQLFNPGTAPAPILLEFVNANGQMVKRSYIVNPRAHAFVDVNSILPNAHVGVIASSSKPFVTLSWHYLNHQTGAAVSSGITPSA